MLSPEQSKSNRGGDSMGGKDSSDPVSERQRVKTSADKEGTPSSTAPKTVRTLHEARPLWVSLLCLFGLVVNIALTLYSHLGVTAEVLTDAPVDEAPDCSASGAGSSLSNLTGACLNAADSALWEGGRKYTNWEDMNSCGVGCGIRALAGPGCVQECMQDKGFSSDCALCFGQQTSCSAQNCLLSCMPPNQNSTACVSCNEEKCDPAWRTCTGLSKAGEDEGAASASPSEGTADAAMIAAAAAAEEEGECRAAPNPADLPPPQAQLSTIPGGVGEITFFYGVIKSWEGNAKAISVIIVLCSGVWPYVNTILLAIAWYAHIAARHRRRILNVVLQLGKWSLVDVFSVMVLVAGLNFTVMGGAYQTIAVAGPAIYTFGASVILHHIQAEWMIGVDRAEEKRNKELAGGAEITATPGASENGDGSEAATDEAAAGSPAGAEQLAPRRLSDAEKGTMTTGGEVVGGVPVVTSSGGAMQQTTSSDSTLTPSSPSCYESSVSWQMVAATTVPALVLTVAGLAGPAISLGIGENGCPPEIRSYSLLTLGSATPMSAADGADGGAFLLPLYYYTFGVAVPLVAAAAFFGMAIWRSALGAAAAAGAPFAEHGSENDGTNGNDNDEDEDEGVVAAATTVRSVRGARVEMAARAAEALLRFGVWCLESLGSFAALDVLAVSVIVIVSQYGSLIGKVSESLMPTCPGQPPPVQLQAEGNLHWGVYAALVSLLPFYFVYIFGASMTKGKVKHQNK